MRPYGFFLMKIQTSPKIKRATPVGGDLDTKKTDPHRGPQNAPRNTQNALQMADLPTLAAIPKIMDEGLWFFF